MYSMSLHAGDLRIYLTGPTCRTRQAPEISPSSLRAGEYYPLRWRWDTVLFSFLHAAFRNASNARLGSFLEPLAQSSVRDSRGSVAVEREMRSNCSFLLHLNRLQGQGRDIVAIGDMGRKPREQPWKANLKPPC